MLCCAVLCCVVVAVVWHAGLLVCCDCDRDCSVLFLYAPEKLVIPRELQPLANMLLDIASFEKFAMAKHGFDFAHWNMFLLVDTRPVKPGRIVIVCQHEFWQSTTAGM
jgi:hypothetical protein